MTLFSKLFLLFPAFEMLLIAVCTLRLVIVPTVADILLLIFVIYGFPPFVFRLVGLLSPVNKEGGSWLDGKVPSPWWIGHQIQLIYVAFPQIEALLKLIPGAFSFWLRLWGSKIGRRVYWTPQVEIMDRNLIEIGDNVILGHRVFCSSHIINRKSGGRTALFVKKIKVGEKAFIGAGVHIGPGVEVAPNAFVPAGTDLYPNSSVKVAGENL